jgi:membrane protease YdiL (CAAX protease family)
MLAEILFKGLSEAEKNAILETAEECYAKAGDLVIAKDSREQSLLVLIEGEFQVIEEGESLFTIHPGEFVGELGFSAQQKRSANVFATAFSKYLKIERTKLEKIENSLHILSQLDRNTFDAFTSHFKSINTAYASSLKTRLRLAQERNHYGTIFILFSFVASIALLTNHLLATSTDISIHSVLFSWAYMILLVAPLLTYCIYTKMPLKEIGLSALNLRKTIHDCLWIAPSLIFLMVYAIPKLDAMFQWGLPLHPFALEKPEWRNPAYALHSTLQEIVSRGIVLQSLLGFFGEQKKFLSLIISSVMFALLHIHFGLGLFFITFIGGLLFGSLYIRHRNIYGVAFIHSLLGLLFFSTWNFSS